MIEKISVIPLLKKGYVQDKEWPFFSLLVFQPKKLTFTPA